MESVQTNSMRGWWCGACGQPDNWIHPNTLLVFAGGRHGARASGFPYARSDGECDSVICELELISNLMTEATIVDKSKHVSSRRRRDNIVDKYSGIRWISERRT